MTTSKNPSPSSKVENCFNQMYRSSSTRKEPVRSNKSHLAALTYLTHCWLGHAFHDVTSRSGPVLQKPINANLRLKINQGVYFSTPKCCSTLIFTKPYIRRSQSWKTKISKRSFHQKVYANPGLIWTTVPWILKWANDVQYRKIVNNLLSLNFAINLSYSQTGLVRTVSK